MWFLLKFDPVLEHIIVIDFPILNFLCFSEINPTLLWCFILLLYYWRLFISILFVH